MNNLFNKNLQALAFKNNNLSKKIEEYVETDVPQLIQDNGAYNFLYKNFKLHNSQSPLSEAKEIFLATQNTPVSIHLVFGLGLGYLFQVASANSKGTVILYEPDLNILKTSFKLVDFSADILKNNVYITDNVDDLCMYLYQKSNTQNLPLLLSTLGYRELYGEKFAKFVEFLQIQLGRYSLDRKYTEEKFYQLTQRLLQNIPTLVKQVPFIELKNRYVGRTAVVVSAGPTLDRNIETIKKYRNNIVLIVVGTAIKTLAANGISPDFLAIIETNDCSKQIDGLDLSNINLITEPTSHPNIVNREYKAIYSHIASNNPINLLWSEIADIDVNEYLSKGTVSYTALNAARILGCSKIVLVGQDLAYIEGQCYSKDSAYKDLECKFNQEKQKWEIVARDFENFSASLGNAKDPVIQRKIAEERIKSLNSALYYVKGINGDMIPTESVYATFIKPLSDYTQIFPDRKYINTSLVGAQIDGFENMPLEEALKNSEYIDNREITINYHYDFSNIMAKLNNEIQGLEFVQKKINELEAHIKNLNNNVKRYKNVTVEVLKDLKKVFTIYSNLNLKNQLFDLLTAAEKIKIDYEIKMVQDFSVENVKKLTEQLNLFSEQATKKIKSTERIIVKIIEQLEENR